MKRSSFFLGPRYFLKSLLQKRRAQQHSNSNPVAHRQWFRLWQQQRNILVGGYDH